MQHASMVNGKLLCSHTALGSSLRGRAIMHACVHTIHTCTVLHVLTSESVNYMYSGYVYVVQTWAV
jgi:hypothetical protein